MSIVFYHNPRCSKSRAVAELLRDRMDDVDVIEYLKNGFSESQLRDVIAALNAPAQALIRSGDEAFKSSNLELSSMNENQVVEFLLEHPQAFQRPVVVFQGHARIGRPPESIKEILA